MNDLLDVLERLFGSRLLVAAILVLMVYFLAHGLLKLASLFRANSGLEARLTALKLHYEILQISSQIRAANPNDRGIMAHDAELAEALKKLAPLHSKLDPGAALASALEGEFTKLASASPPVGIFMYLVAQGARLWWMGFLSYAALLAFIGDEEDTSLTHWDNVIITTVIIFVGFWISNLVVRATRSSNISDPLQMWSYVLGAIGGAIIMTIENM